MSIEKVEQRFAFCYGPSLKLQGKCRIHIKCLSSGFRVTNDHGMASILRGFVRIAETIAGVLHILRSCTEYVAARMQCAELLQRALQSVGQRVISETHASKQRVTTALRNLPCKQNRAERRNL